MLIWSRGGHHCTMKKTSANYSDLHNIPGCEAGWVSGLGLCYHLMPQYATFGSALDKCATLNSKLLNIESQAESDFVSDWLISATSECSTGMLLCWFSREFRFVPLGFSGFLSIKKSQTNLFLICFLQK